MKAAWLAQQDTVYHTTKKRLEAIQGFETAIRRPYWHHKPLDSQQLLNWVAYLDWQQQQQQGGVAAMQRLFERCLVPCANYPGGCQSVTACGFVGQGSEQIVKHSHHWGAWFWQQEQWR
jgi:pre-mRNA-processing factor 39